MNQKPWKNCDLCPKESFTTANQFGDHLRTVHSKREGGSFVCLFGPNGVCPSLPYEGVSDRDYESHIAKCHIFAFNKPESIGARKVQESQQSNNNHYYQQPKAIVAHPVLVNKKKSVNFPLPSKTTSFGLAENEFYGYKNDRNNSVGVISNEWNIYSSSQNITSVLNDPSKQRSYYDNLFTKDWGSNFVELNNVAPYAILKKSSNLLFDNYLKKVSKRTKRNLRSKAIAKQFPANESLANQIVPSLFFDSNFNLEDSETFIQLLKLFDSDHTVDNLQTFFGQNSMNDVQKLLSENLDVVEQDLAQQIGQRSKDFFQVMSSMDNVMEKLKVAIRRVTLIREHCYKLKDNLVSSIQVNIDKHFLRTQYRDIYRKINWIATVHQTQPTIQLLLSKNDYAGALDLISTSQEVVTQELSGVISFRHLKLQLMEIEKVIERMMNEEFIKYLTAEWNRPFTGEENIVNIHEERLLSIIYGMLKLQKFDFIDTFREEAFTAIKTNVKQTVIEVLSTEDSVEVSRIDASLFEQLMYLSFDKWLSCLENVFTRLEALLRRVKCVYNVISNGFLVVTNNRSDTLKGYDSSHQESNFQPNGLFSVNGDELNMKVILQSDYYELNSNLKEILCSVCDFSHSRCANIIELRVNDERFASIKSSEFLELIRLIDEFVGNCENICGRTSPSLKLIVQLQSNKFVTKFHTERKEKLRESLDTEQWKAVSNLSEHFQHFCNQLVDGERNLSIIEVFADYKKTKTNKKSTTDKKINFIQVKNYNFVLVTAVINLVYIMLEYCEYAQEMPFLCPDLLLRLVDLLKSFNSRTSQLVLGAGALQIAGLKTISARTLITSTRSLTFVTMFIPPIKAHFESLLGTQQKNMLKHFDEIIELYDNHCSKIPEKVIGLVRDVVVSNLNKWVAKAPVPSSSFTSISQHLGRLHDNIQDIMSEEELVALFQKIHNIVIQTFRNHLVKLKIAKDGGPQHGLVTQELMFYVQNLRNLGIGDKIDLSIEELWSK